MNVINDHIVTMTQPPYLQFLPIRRITIDGSTFHISNQIVPIGFQQASISELCWGDTVFDDDKVLIRLTVVGLGREEHDGNISCFHAREAKTCTFFGGRGKACVVVPYVQESVSKAYIYVSSIILGMVLIVPDIQHEKVIESLCFRRCIQ